MARIYISRWRVCAHSHVRPKNFPRLFMRRAGGFVSMAHAIKTKGNRMVVTLTVFKEVHNTWPAKNGKPGGESFDLLCMDMSNPAEHRMEEMLYYRTKEEERPKIWGKS